MAGHRDRDGIMIKLARPIKYALHGTGPGIAAPTNKREKKCQASGGGHSSFSISEMEEAETKFCVMCGEPLRKGEVLVCILHAGQVLQWLF